MKVKFITYLILIPLVAILFIFFDDSADHGGEAEAEHNTTEQIYEYEMPEEEPYYYDESPEPDFLPEEEITAFAEKEPQFPGGEVAMQEFIADNIRYPEPEREMGLDGTIYVQFVVDKEGAIRNIEIVKDIPGGVNFGPEVIRVIKSMPAWIPGEQNGDRVNVRFTLPVKFKIQ